ncbi:hypothetical protein WI40_29820 [Burkholderia ubonensis]|nr:hypothetical protein WI40_29820 [Burkholderia ubonensis]KVA16526.1 hypothetical protein WI43_22585 [Burkholderia ubonensis]KVA53716.1 hypothetical protein WI46_25510 [Burkholderia ubonensis]
MIISIDGLPGIGKTTLSMRLSRRYGVPFLPELCLPSLNRADYDEGAFVKNDMRRFAMREISDMRFWIDRFVRRSHSRWQQLSGSMRRASMKSSARFTRVSALPLISWS